MNKTTARIFLDQRRLKSNNKYPVKLRVYTSRPKRWKYYSTQFDLTLEEFNKVWNTINPRGINQQLKRQLQSIEYKALEVIEGLTPFTFESFELRLYRKEGSGINIQWHYERAIKEYTEQNRLGTADGYKGSMKSLQAFVGSGFSSLSFFDVNSKWLQRYENWMISNGRSKATVGIYLRSLRVLFNRAIDDKEIERDYYPFGKRRYQIPTSAKVNKVLSIQQLSTLYNSIPLTKEQQRSKDFWFFSYACSGMNMKDIVLLKKTDIVGDKLTFYRAKTIRSNAKPIVVYLNSFAKSIIDKYQVEGGKYVFDIANDKMDNIEIHDKVKRFTRSINKNLQKLAKSINLPSDITTYYARHSFATNSIRNGASMEFIGESLGHSNVKTTMSYFSGFDDESKREFSSKLMDF